MDGRRSISAAMISLVLILFALGAWSCAKAPDAAEPTAGRAPGTKPLNIVFILADDLGWKDVGFQGSSYPTPNIDRMAREGMVFSHAYAASPSCSPTRAAILTGKHPARLRITRAIRNEDYLAARAPPKKPGASPHFRCLPVETRTFLPEGEPTLATRLAESGWDTGFVGKWHLGEHDHFPAQYGFAHTAAIGATSAAPYFPPYRVQGLSRKRPTGYLTDVLSDEALLFLRRPREGPFFLFLAQYAVHGPLRGKPELVRRFEQELDPDSPQSNAVYAAMIESLDEGVGQILATLDELGLAEDTVVVFTSDNGPTLAEDGPVTTVAPMRGGKLDFYEGGLRVPLVVRWKGHVTAGARCDVPVTSMDFFPTLLSLCGIESQEGDAPDGLDVSTLLSGGQTPPRDLYFYMPHREPGAAVLAGTEKLVHTFSGPSELYDLAADPGETKDLAAQEPARVAELERRLLAWVTSVGAEIPAPNPNYDGRPLRARDVDEKE